MKCYEATYQNNLDEKTVVLVGGHSFKAAAFKAVEQETDKRGQLVKLELTEKVIL